MTKKEADKLVESINDCCYGTRGDPISDTLLPASVMFELLHADGYHNMVDSATIDLLCGNNIEQCNYLDGIMPPYNTNCKCGNPAEDLHTCPYSEDIYGDSETLCNCCDDCEHNCLMDI